MLCFRCGERGDAAELMFLLYNRRTTSLRSVCRRWLARSCIFLARPLQAMVVSVAQRAKRAFVGLLLASARLYDIGLVVSRDSEDQAIEAGFRKVIRKAHPDKGGNTRKYQELQAARDAWRESGRHARRGAGRPQVPLGHPAGLSVTSDDNLEGNARKMYELNCAAVLLTYHGVEDLLQWRRFLTAVSGRMRKWNVRHWCATLETCKSGTWHAHLMLQFTKKQEHVGLTNFIFEGLRPNVAQNGGDYCGEGLRGKKGQQSVDRGMFYVWAPKQGTVVDDRGHTCVGGNYFPAWVVEEPRTYQVLGKWVETLWKQYKLTHDTYEDLLYLCRDGILGRKRNLDAVRDHDVLMAETAVVAERVKRIRADTSIFRPFPDIPEAQAWLSHFKVDALRYPALIVFGPSRAGKTEWAKSLFQQPLEIKIGTLTHFPDSMRQFRRGYHDGIVLDDVRDLQFLADHQEKLQGKYDTLVEFASTAGGTCAYRKDLFAVPMAATVNRSTANLDFLDTHDWLGNPHNRHVINYRGFA
jgi:hypothetical protein